MMLATKIALARAAGALSRRTGRGGTSLPGKLLMRLQPDAIARLAARLPDGSAVISATNGKTTTAAMVAAILEGDGARLVHNRAGANMAGGVTTALLDAARGAGGIDGDAGLFEVDEFWLDRVIGPYARARCCWRTSFATSSTATASSRRSPIAGRRRSSRRPRRAWS